MILIFLYFVFVVLNAALQQLSLLRTHFAR